MSGTSGIEQIQSTSREFGRQGTDRQRVLIEAARMYMHRGYSPVPINAGEKAPCIKNWETHRLHESDLEWLFRSAGNIGLRLGATSHDLVDVDLDCIEARELADQILPPTEAVTGRPSSPKSHRWYYCPAVQTRRHQDPKTRASIVEIRGTGCQTLVGPSIHPSGEPYDFLRGEPASIDMPALCAAVQKLANEVVLRRHGFIPEIRPVSPPRSPVPVTIDHNRLLRRASAYLGAMPAAISGQGGHKATYAAATVLVHGFDLTEAEAFDLLRDKFNPRCQPAWSDKELLHKVTDAANKPHRLPRGWLIGQGR